MAISRHDPEWKRAIATAALAGVTFSTVSRRIKAGYYQNTYVATTQHGFEVRGGSKYEAAIKVAQYLATGAEDGIAQRRGATRPVSALQRGSEADGRSLRPYSIRPRRRQPRSAGEAGALGAREMDADPPRMDEGNGL